MSKEKDDFDGTVIVKRKLWMFLDMTGKKLPDIEKDCAFEAGTLVAAFDKCYYLDHIDPDKIYKMGEIINKTYNLYLGWSQNESGEEYPKDKIALLKNCSVL